MTTLQVRQAKIIEMYETHKRKTKAEFRQWIPLFLENEIINLEDFRTICENLDRGDGLSFIYAVNIINWQIVNNWRSRNNLPSLEEVNSQKGVSNGE